MRWLLLACLAAAFFGCDDPAILVPVEFAWGTGTWTEAAPGVDSVSSVSFVGDNLVVEGVIGYYCERFTAVASQWTGDRRAVVRLFVVEEEVTDVKRVCVIHERSPPLRYAATIGVQQPVTASLTAWEVRVYHRGTRLPVPPWGPDHHHSSLGLER